MPGHRFDQDVGSPTNQRVVTVTSTAQKITLTGARFKTMEWYNADPTNKIYFGDSTVTSANGMPLLAGDYRIFRGAQNAFSAWVVCSAGQTANLNIIEYP
jgi:hypothetical protein